MSFHGQWDTWKVVYEPMVKTPSAKGVALVEAGDQQHAMQVFREQYAGQFWTIESCRRLIG